MLKLVDGKGLIPIPWKMFKPRCRHQYYFPFSCVIYDILSVSFCVISTAFVWQSRRTTLISAEQKRRSNIKIGFKTLCNLVPTLTSQSNVSLCTLPETAIIDLGHHNFWSCLCAVFASCVVVDV